MAASALHHEILIIGAGSAGRKIAARHRRAKAFDVALIDPAETHYHQSLRMLVGAGVATALGGSRTLPPVSTPTGAL